MGNCKDCKYWDEPDNWASGGTEYRPCLKVQTEEETDIKKSLAFCLGYDASGTLMTKPEYGCVLFESVPIVESTG